MSNPPAGAPEGVYGGTLTGSDSSSFEMVVLESGEYWSIYGTDTHGDRHDQAARQVGGVVIAVR